MNKFTITIFFLVFTFLVPPVYAQVNDIGFAQISPASPLYFLKAVKETVELKLANTTNARAYRQMEFAASRMREVKSLVNSTRQDLIQPTLEMYWWHVTELNGILSLTDEREIAKAVKEFPVHIYFLQSEYQQVENADAKRSIRTTINRLSVWEKEIAARLDSLNKTAFAVQFKEPVLSGCKFLTKEASSSALGEVEKFVYKERALKCLQTNQ